MLGATQDFIFPFSFDIAPNNKLFPQDSVLSSVVYFCVPYSHLPFRLSQKQIPFSHQIVATTDLSLYYIFSYLYALFMKFLHPPLHPSIGRHFFPRHFLRNFHFSTQYLKFLSSSLKKFYRFRLGLHFIIQLFTLTDTWAPLKVLFLYFLVFRRNIRFCFLHLAWAPLYTLFHFLLLFPPLPLISSTLQISLQFSLKKTTIHIFFNNLDIFYRKFFKLFPFFMKFA